MPVETVVERFKGSKESPKLLGPEENTDSSISDIEDSQPDFDISKLKGVKVVSLVAHTGTRNGELDLKRGQTIYQMFPANEQGYAFGYIRKGKFRRKEQGFYPVNIVALKVKSKKTEKEKKQSKTYSHDSDYTDDENDDIQVQRIYERKLSIDESETCKNTANRSTNRDKPRLASESPDEMTNFIPKPKLAFEEFNNDKSFHTKDDKSKESNKERKVIFETKGKDETKTGFKNPFRKLFKF